MHVKLLCDILNIEITPATLLIKYSIRIRSCPPKKNLIIQTIQPAGGMRGHILQLDRWLGNSRHVGAVPFYATSFISRI
jgi:hypothetical protein